MGKILTAWAEGIKHTGTIGLPAAEARTSLIDARDIADAATAALRSNRFDGRAFTLTGPEALTFQESATALSKATGRQITCTAIDDETFVTASVAAGVPDDLARYLADLFAVVREGATASTSPAVEELTGHAPGRSTSTPATTPQHGGTRDRVRA